MIERFQCVVCVLDEIDVQPAAVLEPSSMFDQRLQRSRRGGIERCRRIGGIERQVRKCVDLARLYRDAKRAFDPRTMNRTPQRGCCRHVPQFQQVTLGAKRLRQPAKKGVGNERFETTGREDVDAIGTASTADERDAGVRQRLTHQQRNQATQFDSLP